jgi:GTPase SAR1 family protein
MGEHLHAKGSIECTQTLCTMIISTKVNYIYFKLIVILTGDAGVGKSNFLLRYVSGIYENVPSTIGVEFAYKVSFLKNKTKVKAQIWDTCMNFNC